MTTTNVTTLNSENINPSDLREICLDDREWDEPQPSESLPAQRVLPGLKVTGVTGQHRRLKQQLQRLLQESSFSVLLTSLRELADDRSEWCCSSGYVEQSTNGEEAELLDLLSLSIDRAATRAARWCL